MHVRFEAVNAVDVDAVVADCGPAGLTWRGPFDDDTFYNAGDVTTFQGSTYRAIIATTDAFDPADWQLLAARGPVGDAGPEGLPGAVGLPGPPATAAGAG